MAKRKTHPSQRARDRRGTGNSPSKLAFAALGLAVALLAYSGLLPDELVGSKPVVGNRGIAEEVAALYDAKRSDVIIEGGGTVATVLSDDKDGSRHQRFILELAPGRTLLVAHNIDLAPRITSIQRGDRVEFRGEYEWNERGGVLHWTHADPGGNHPGGWLRHGGQVYR